MYSGRQRENIETFTEEGGSAQKDQEEILEHLKITINGGDDISNTEANRISKLVNRSIENIQTEHRKRN